MGGRSSKSEGFVRSSSFRKTQKNTLQRIERKLNKTSKDIEKFKGTIDDSKYTRIKQNITEIIDDLEKISATVKDKYQATYQKIVDRCQDELQKLDAKVGTTSPPISPVASPTPSSLPNAHISPVDSPLSERSSHSVQVKLVKIALEAEAAAQSAADRPGSERSSKPTEEVPKIDLEQQAVDIIDATRKKIEYLESEIHTYKSDPSEELYGYIRESLNQIIVKLDTMETFGNIQIKHERKLALQRAQECLRYLNDGTIVEEKPGSPVSPRELSRHDKERLSNRGVYRPITLDLNINDKLNEELQSVIHKRMEEATRDIEKPVEEKLSKSEPANRSAGDSFENFDNPDSEDEFDFVCADDKEKSKSTSVLITSF